MNNTVIEAATKAWNTAMFCCVVSPLSVMYLMVLVAFLSYKEPKGGDRYPYFFILGTLAVFGVDQLLHQIFPEVSAMVTAVLINVMTEVANIVLIVIGMIADIVGTLFYFFGEAPVSNTLFLSIAVLIYRYSPSWLNEVGLTIIRVATIALVVVSFIMYPNHMVPRREGGDFMLYVMLWATALRLLYEIGEQLFGLYVYINQPPRVGEAVDGHLHRVAE